MKQENKEAKKLIRKQQRFKLAVGMNTLVAVALFAVVVVMVNYVSYRRYWRADWSRSDFYTLSDKTVKLLNSVTNTINVVVFFQPGHSVYEDIENLLREYEYVSDRMRVTWVDPDRDLAQTERLAAKYEVNEANVIVFDVAGRFKYITADDVAEYDYTPMQYGQPPRQLSFKGEQAFSSAIQSITQAGKPVVYFLEGHGEGNVEDFDPRVGFSAIGRKVRRDNVEVRSLTLGEAQEVPADAAAVIILGPDGRISKPEISLLGDYLERSGRLMVLIDASTTTGLEPLLAQWGIVLGNDLVVDATRTITGRELFLTEYGDHPITRALEGVTSIFYLPRSVRPADKNTEDSELADRPHVTALASCSESGWAESETQEGVMSFDPLTDLPGPVPVAVAMEKGPVPGIDVKIKPTRMVVLGDSDFVSNAAMTGGDEDFFMSALNWLLEREELMAISPKTVEESHLVMSSRQLAFLFWIVVVGLPAAIGVFGLFVWWRRRG